SGRAGFGVSAACAGSTPAPADVVRHARRARPSARVVIATLQSERSAAKQIAAPTDIVSLRRAGARMAHRYHLPRQRTGVPRSDDVGARRLPDSNACLE